MPVRRTSNGRVYVLPHLSLKAEPAVGSPSFVALNTAPHRGLQLTKLQTISGHKLESRCEASTNSKAGCDQRYDRIQVKNVRSHRNLCASAVTPRFTPTLPPLSVRSARRHGAGATALTAQSRRESDVKRCCRRDMRTHPNEEGGMLAKEVLQRLWKRLRKKDRIEIERYDWVWYVPTVDVFADGDTTDRSQFLDCCGTRECVHGDCVKSFKGEHIAFRFELLSLLGAGNFGQVFQCYDHKHSRRVAVKMIKVDTMFKDQTRVEIKTLERASIGSSRVVQMFEHFSFRKHKCVVLELLHINLYELLAARKFERIRIEHVRHIATQMVDALLYLKQIGVVHCDIKPENILLVHAETFDVKLIDFGSACFEGHSSFTYIQSRFYRAPEVMLGIEYGHPIDMWSLACVLAELATGRTLFVGDDEAQQLSIIANLIGPPPTRMITEASHPNRRVDCHVSTSTLLDDTSVTSAESPLVRSLRKRPHRTQHIVDVQSNAFNAFLRRALHWCPSRRLSPADAKAHRFLRSRKRSTPRLTAQTSPRSSPRARRER
ncbi:Serine/threonine-protein kinase, active site [Ostreococcus tauri]|uniref:Serine/threonine-protein kinase, active site n=1 Tax=Ostreococcus tauri TaxID=70448 RepID=A0A090M5N4_OSTTA|nr:Serine/threonine-protein kinase, active site [Ostreococcus tauri]CEF97982.1 Serine/threonine-protein kinase, active site [Ostreococcus tauri]|eukprot:XP_022839008.1 Serine/threonine-protein kinase, active site [Ostreococcus tauri]